MGMGMGTGRANLGFTVAAHVGVGWKLRRAIEEEVILVKTARAE